ncbi:MAG: hypothetical protein IKE51_04855 [Solobacterium sp.]|nr:hypothetical protein [Solobacterium sp.]
MFEIELKQILQDNLGALTERFVNQHMTTAAFEKLKVEETSDSFIMNNVMDRCLAALIKCGEVLYEEDNTLVGIIMSGLMKTNPVLIAMMEDEDRVYIRLAAREGFISQKSVEKALRRFKECL